MKDPVLLKGNHFGLTIVLDPKLDFDTLLEAIGDKFESANGFFNSEKQIAIRIEGRTLTTKQVEQMIDMISKKSSLMIAYVMEEDKVVETTFKEVVERSIRLTEEKNRIHPKDGGVGFGQFYKGTLRSGQSLESDASVVVVGDVNPGAMVTAKGNVVILGCAKGNIYAGIDGDENAFIAALDMQPMQVRIGSLIARSSDDEDHKRKKRKIKFGRQSKDSNQMAEAQIAFVEDGNIYIEPISKALLNEITVL